MKVKIGAFSDCHDPYFLRSPFFREFILKQELDIFIFAGDFCIGGFKYFQLKDFGKNLKGLAKNVIFVPGNHDFLRADGRVQGSPLDYNNRINAFKENPELSNFLLMRDALDDIIVMGYDEDSFYHECMVNESPVRIAASCWVKLPDDRWAFCANSDEGLLNVASRFNNQADILVTHAPPYCSLGEFSISGKRCNLGDPYMTIHAQKVIKPKLWISGHVHEGYGSQFLDFDISDLIKFGHVAKPNNPLFDAMVDAYRDMPACEMQAYNVALVDANYSLANKIIFPELEL